MIYQTAGISFASGATAISAREQATAPSAMALVSAAHAGTTARIATVRVLAMAAEGVDTSRRVFLGIQSERRHMLAWTLSLILTCPLPYVESCVDVIELNHVHNSNAECTLSQIILWRDGHVAWWCHAPRAGHVRRVGGWYRMDVRHSGRLYRVTAPAYRETWTHHDPEVLDRENVATEFRGGL